ncbi:MAG: histidine phosphatase family protein [Saprospiraceae bacterium]|nr:histidine phosphatase family protein [Saprospiraceae bacterium]MBP7699145.1 histidine phosphatase family protein [Saprospiraceae bacterium]
MHIVNSCLLIVLMLNMQSCHKKQTSKFIEKISGDGTITFVDGSKQSLPTLARTDTITTFFMVRHAEKQKGSNPDPELTPEGVQRAERLAKILQDVPINMVAFTPYKRTALTALPLMNIQGMSNATYTPEVQNSIIQDFVNEGRGGNFLVVGHQNTIPKLANFMLGKPDLFKNFADDEYDNLLIISLRKTGDADVLALKY